MCSVHCIKGQQVASRFVIVVKNSFNFEAQALYLGLKSLDKTETYYNAWNIEI